MNDTIVLHGVAVGLDSPEARSFVTDACRAGEALLTDKELAEIYKLTPQELEKLANNPAIGDAIRRERASRVRNGTAAREAAAARFVKAPAVLDEIMSDKTTHPKFRIESAKALKETAFAEDNKQTPANAAEKFVITINMGPDRIETYEKDITPLKQLPKDSGDWGWDER